MAVPGSISSPASAGTNRLISEGCPPVCDVDDVLVAMALDTAGRRPHPRPDVRPPPGPDEAAVLEALGYEAISTEQLLARTELSPGQVAVALAHLEHDGRARGGGGWWERVPPP